MHDHCGGFCGDNMKGLYLKVQGSIVISHCFGEGLEMKLDIHE